MSTICAISTAQAVGGISLIRLSGDKAIAIADEIFVSFDGKRVKDMQGHTCKYGKIVVNGNVLDDVLLTVFIAPKSYTGEDTVEISCHGGLYVSKRVLRACIDHGAEPAAAGEFTKRAFLNGKLSLTEAEGVADIISAQGESTLKSAHLMHEGELYKSVRRVCDRLVNILGSLAAWTDYPDEDIPETDDESLLVTLEGCETSLKKILADYDSGRIFREGIDTAIVGKPNVGKSTLMNALLGYERSIVTSVAGTTRDIVEESVRLGDVILRLSDTAGIHESQDEVESIGVDLAKKKIDSAELILCVLDGSRELDDDDRELLKSIENRRHIVLVNKSDLPLKINKEYILDGNILYVSAKERDGLENLRRMVFDLFKLSGYDSSPAVFANERQKLCCERALKHVKFAHNALLAGLTLDAVTIDIDEAANALLELTGEKATEAVVDDVFSRFCVGK
ncbi:MAG: tRNA uridine-5-carboxymethylaminomethyl(34) synthesis GTPase MnmE [Oscillospiraceae bacterium]|nr:tRNA uridine-5-carboxymethylaminomethyl(34) synthesis GTPase MnmE [Oscillospiraceae bacterium]